MIQRYDRTGCFDIECRCGGTMEPSADGDYVLYSDHQARVKVLRDALKMARDAWDTKSQRRNAAAWKAVSAALKETE